MLVTELMDALCIYEAVYCIFLELMDALCIYEAVYCIFLCWFVCKAVSSELRK